jgi:hypothetical protein
MVVYLAAFIFTLTLLLFRFLFASVPVLSVGREY